MADIDIYVTEEGKAPFEEWFEKLDSAAALKVRTALARIETGDLGDVKPVGQGASLSAQAIEYILARTATRL